MVENEEKVERVLLAALDTGEYEVESSLSELSELVKTAGACPEFELVQKRPSPDTATCFGSGMAEELAQLVQREELDLVVFDRELSPTQIRNLEKLCRVRVIDRTTLILDIFAKHAQSREGKLQVELAQLRYLLPRLSGQGTSLSRLGAGIGTRGPGETKLETDRRHIRRRIGNLKAQLEDVKASREVIEKHRKKAGTVTVALVGYTNAGKSTLMNQLTGAGVLAEDKLFATLDPTARALKLPGGKTVMLIDTVGLVRRLPHHLIEAFRSTLEQAATADILLNICDASSPEAGEHLQVTKELLESLGCTGRPVIPVLNKWDAAADNALVPHLSGAVRISALTGQGIEALLKAVEDNLPEKTFEVKLLLPFSKGGLAARLREEGAVLSEEYVEDGLKLTARVGERLYGLVREYDTEKQSAQVSDR